jgi:hypothetical protein
LQISDNIIDHSSSPILGTTPCSVQFDLSPAAGSTQTTTTTSLTTSKSTSKDITTSRSSSSDSSSSSSLVSLSLRFPDAGVFHGLLTYDDKPVQHGKFEIVVLSSTEAAGVQKNVAAKSPNAFYEGKLVQMGNEVQTKVRKVYVSVTSKQLIVKEYLWKLLPIRIATFRLSPNTKVVLSC